MIQWFVRRRITTPFSMYLCGFYCGAFFVTSGIPQISDMLLLFPERVVPAGEVWRLVSYGLFPINFLSLILLVIPTLWFGAYLEPALHPGRYLAIYLLPHAASGVLIVLMRMGSLEGLPYAGSFIAASGAWAAFIAWGIANFRSTTWPVRFLVPPVGYFLVAIVLAPVDIIAIHFVAWATGIALAFPALRRSRAIS